MTCTYRRKRIPDLPPEATRALDDEFQALEIATDCSLKAVVDDPAPILGGDLATHGYHIIVTDDDGIEQGRLVDVTGGGLALVHTGADGTYEYTDGGIGLYPGRLRLAGSTVGINSLTSDGFREVWATKDGDLYTVKPPTPGWEVTDTDGATYGIGTSWTVITGLAISTPVDVLAGERWDFLVRLHIANSGNEAGDIQIGVGLGFDYPAGNGVFASVAANFDGWITVSGWNITSVDLPTGQVVKVWVMESAGNPPQFDATANGTSINQHELVVSVPAGEGATGSTNLAVTNITADSLTITSDTGADAVLPAATSLAAGLATAAQVAALEAATPMARKVDTADGLQGGGDLTADRTLSPLYGSVAKTVCEGNDPRLTNPYRVYYGGVLQGVLSETDGGGLGVGMTNTNGEYVVGYGGISFNTTTSRIAGTHCLVDSLASGSQKVVLANADGTLVTGAPSTGATNLSVSNVTATNLTIESDTGTDAVLPAATNATAGLATAAQIAQINAAAPQTRYIYTSNGLQGGGDLSVDRTLSPLYGQVAGTVCQGNDPRLSNPYRVYWNGVLQGVLSEVDGGGIGVGMTDPTGQYQPGYGGVSFTTTDARIAGTNTVVDSLATGSAKAVTADANGKLGTTALIGGTDLSVGLITATNLSILSSTGNSAQIPAATPSLAGLATAAQVTAIAAAVPNTRAINTTEGLQGGGNLSLDRTIKPLYGTTINTVCMGNDSRFATILKYMGNWAAGAYALNDVVRTRRWLARANKTTSQVPDPVTNGRKQVILNEPAWTSYTAGWSENGIEIKVVPAKIILTGLRVKIPVAGTINVAIGINDNTYINLFAGFYLEANRWTDLIFAPLGLNQGEKVDFMVGSGSRYESANYFPLNDNVQGFVRAGFPVQPGELSRTAYAVNGIYEDISSWPTDWDLLSGY